MRTRKGLFNNDNVTILNIKVAAIIPIHNVDKQIIIVKQNAIQHTIN